MASPLTNGLSNQVEGLQREKKTLEGKAGQLGRDSRLADETLKVRKASYFTSIAFFLY